MSRAFRIILVLVISLTLPFQGAVAAAMYACAGHEASAVGAVGAVGVWYGVAAGAGHVDHSPAHGPAHGHSADAPAKSADGHKTSASKCSVCAFCFFTAAGLPAGLPRLEPQALAEAVFPALITRPIVFTTGVPERPPRPIPA